MLILPLFFDYLKELLHPPAAHASKLASEEKMKLIDVLFRFDQRMERSSPKEFILAGINMIFMIC
jgi:hypothetical protein